MAQASKRSIKPQPLTEEQIKQNQARFYLQKRESFAQGILYNLCNNPGAFPTAINEPAVLVSKAVKMADLLMKGLFIDPIPELNEMGSKPQEEAE